MDNNLYIPKISEINRLRRECLDDLKQQAIERFTRKSKKISIKTDRGKKKKEEKKFNLILNELNLDFDYSKIDKVDGIYIPLKFFLNKQYSEKILELKNQNLYINLPVIVKDNFRNIFFNDIDDFIEKYNIKGIVITNLAGIEYWNKYKDKLEIVASYNLNIFNNYSLNEISKLGIDRIALSPELNKNELIEISKNATVKTELYVYGRLPLMNMGYCLLGKTNKCYPDCEMRCKSNKRFYLKDRMDYVFRVVPDNTQTITTIYNSKITSIDYSDIEADYVNIYILEENIEKINEIINNVKSNIIFKGKNYTNGNFNKEV